MGNGDATSLLWLFILIFWALVALAAFEVGDTHLPIADVGREFDDIMRCTEKVAEAPLDSEAREVLRQVRADASRARREYRRLGTLPRSCALTMVVAAMAGLVFALAKDTLAVVTRGRPKHKPLTATSSFRSAKVWQKRARKACLQHVLILLFLVPAVAVFAVATPFDIPVLRVSFLLAALVVTALLIRLVPRPIYCARCGYWVGHEDSYHLPCERCFTADQTGPLWYAYTPPKSKQ